MVTKRKNENIEKLKSIYKSIKDNKLNLDFLDRPISASTIKELENKYGKPNFKI